MDQTQHISLIAGLSLLLAVTTTHAEMALPPELKLQTTILKRCSRAELTAFRMIHVGNAALYLDNCVAKPDIFSDQAKQLRFVYEREIPAHAFQETSMEYLKTNLGEKFTAWEAAFKNFNNYYQDVKAGDYYDLTYTPKQGLSLSLNGTQLGNITDKTQALAYLNVWFGEEPFSDKLKEDLLTIKP